MGILYVVATPIGNLEDITLRALRILKEVDLIACEDTRVTKKLLQRYEIDKQTISLHQHSGAEHYEKIVNELLNGKNIAYVSDAGTPGVSDPGNMLVAAAVEKELTVLPIPGTSALAAMISIAGIDLQKFTFMGFPPHKKGRETYFKQIIASEIPIIYYESPHRVIRNLELLQKLGGQKNIIIGRELTKMFEEIVRGNAQEIIEYFTSNPGKIKGEFAVIVY